MQILLIKKVEPKRPTDGVHIRGVAVLQALVDKEGNVENLKVISGHPMLLPAALDAVKPVELQTR
jgi:periplasmic protein TonB